MTRLDVAKKNAHLLIEILGKKAIEIFGDAATDDALMAMWLASITLAKTTGTDLRGRFPEPGQLLKALEESVADA